MSPGVDSIRQKAASGWPPVADKNLRPLEGTAVPIKQKSRRVAAPRRSGAGTCEKPSPDALSLPRRQATAPPQPTAQAAARTVTLLSRQTVHLHTGPHSGTVDTHVG